MFGNVLREAVDAAWAQRVGSLLVIVVVGAMCATVTLTVGKTVAARDSIVGSLDSAGTRTIIIRADPQAGVTTGALERVETLDGTELVVGFGPAVDAHNALLSAGTLVPVRPAYGPDLNQLGIPKRAVADATFVSTSAQERLGMSAPTGSVVTGDALDLPVVGQISNEMSDTYLGFLEPVALTPRASQGAEPLTILLVTVTDPAAVGDVGAAVVPLLGASDPTKVTLETSARLAELRDVVDNQLSGFSTRLVLGAFTVSGVLVACLLTGLVLLRRRDFGRRRALGATRGIIMTLVLGQVGVCGLVGAVLSSTGASIYLVAGGIRGTSVSYEVAVAVCAVAVALCAAVVPALVAASRDPLHELRVP